MEQTIDLMDKEKKMQLHHLDSVPASARPGIETWFSTVLSAFENEIDSVYLYGSIVTPDYKPKESDINSMILFTTFSFEGVIRLQPFVQKGLKSRIVAPLCLGVETFERSADTFPMEFIEIQDKHLCIYGVDRVASLPIPTEPLRVKIEEQIKGKLIRLRQIFMEHGQEPKYLKPVLEEALRELLPVFRNMLRFQGVEQPPIVKQAILEELQRVNSLSLEPCFRVLNSLENAKPIPPAEVVPVYSEFADRLLQLGRVIDQLEQA